jgi:hypothetical protein
LASRFFKLGWDEVDIALVHHTGRMIRFRPSLAAVIPKRGREVRVLLPDGGSVPGKFNPNPRNPNITGPELVAWIRSQVGQGRTKPARLRETDGGLKVILRGRTIADVDEDHILPAPLAVRVRKFRSERDRRKLKRAFNGWERDPRLRAAMLERWKPRCQVEGCPIADTLPSSLQATVVELHHLTHISDGGSDDPLNLALVCAAHHRLIHLGGPSEVEERTDGVVIIRMRETEMCVKRDIKVLLD